MAINYNDNRFAQVNEEKTQALNNVNSMYNNMISNSDKYYQDQINAVKDYANTQQQNQQAQTDFAIEKVNQQKEQALKDYTKEQTASNVDYQKASNEFGANAEAMAQNGLANTGFSESSQVSMFNQYQQRYASAREVYNRAVLNYDNAIKDAQLQNNSALAEIAYKALQQELELSLQGFQYKNNLLQTQLEQVNATEDRYYARWQDVVSQINTENALAEQQRQFNEQMDFQREQASIENTRYQASINGGSNGGGSNGSGDSGNAKISKKEDYYFSNGYQPKYVGNEKLQQSGRKVSDIFGGFDSSTKQLANQNLWTTSSGKYYVWDGSRKDYIDVTSKVKSSDTNRVNYRWGS